MDSMLYFPVKCPVCEHEELATVPFDIVARAIWAGDTIPLLASCHNVHWKASAAEVEQIREYFEAARLGTRQAS